MAHSKTVAQWHSSQCTQWRNHCTQWHSHHFPAGGTTKYANPDDLLGSDPSDLYFVYGTIQNTGTVVQ